MRPKIKLTLIDRKGLVPCHRGHKIGDTYDFDTERGKVCPMAMHVAFPYIDILRYGGKIPGQPEGTAVFCCPDVDTLNIWKIEEITDHEISSSKN
ncbi:MAG: TIGR04076 family protein [Peptococcaceae bacterium]